MRLDHGAVDGAELELGGVFGAVAGHEVEQARPRVERNGGGVLERRRRLVSVHEKRSR
jgi:hypothetical protein